MEETLVCSWKGACSYVNEWFEKMHLRRLSLSFFTSVEDVMFSFPPLYSRVVSFTTKTRQRRKRRAEFFSRVPGWKTKYCSYFIPFFFLSLSLSSISRCFFEFRYPFLSVLSSCIAAAAAHKVTPRTLVSFGEPHALSFRPPWSQKSTSFSDRPPREVSVFFGPLCFHVLHATPLFSNFCLINVSVCNF